MSCESVFSTEWHTSILLEAANDPDSRAGYYLRFNPDLKPYVPRPNHGMRKNINNTFSYRVSLSIDRTWKNDRCTSR